MKQMQCSSCEKVWYYELDRCIFCSSTLKEIEPSELHIVEKTEVHVPSLSHKDTPYYNLLLQDQNLNYQLIQSYTDFKIGDIFSTQQQKNSNRFRFGFVGTGVMSTGLAIIALQNGNEVILKSRSNSNNESTKSKITYGLEKVGYSQEEISHIDSKVTITTNWNDLSKCDLIIENVKDDLAIKQSVFEELDRHCQSSILASNTSSLPIHKIAARVKNKERVLLFFLLCVIQMVLSL